MPSPAPHGPRRRLRRPRPALQLAAGAALAVAGATLLRPGLAAAGNTVHPRTPMLWPDEACIQTVDRSVDPSYLVRYDIPFEDTKLTADELPDSRRHQVIALCRQRAPAQPLPRYVSVADLQRSIDAELEPSELIDEPSATLETSPDWQGCWHRANADDDRRPITFEAAQAGIEWDTASVPTGVYQLAGYTWEPALNLWRPAPRVVRVVDGPDDEVGPAVVLPAPPQVVRHDEPIVLSPCVQAPAGTVLRLAWSPGGDAPTYTPLAELTLDGDPPRFEILAPEPSWGLRLRLRIEAEDPEGARYVAYAPEEIIVIAPPSTPDPSDDGGGDDDDAGLDHAGPSEAGAGCRVVPTIDGAPVGAAAAALWFLGLVGGIRRRRPPLPSRGSS